MRTDLNGDPTVREALHRVRDMCLDGYANSDVPFEQLMDVLRPDRATTGQSALFQIMFQFLPAQSLTVDMADVSMTLEEIKTDTAKFDLLLDVVETEETLEGVVQYSTGLYRRETVDDVLAQWTAVLGQFPDSLDIPLTQLTLSPGATGTATEHGVVGERLPASARLLHGRFKELARVDPDRPALRTPDRTLTYGELDNSANQLAHTLQAKGVGPETIVALCTDRSVDMLVAVLGVLKAGGAYVPLDPESPDHRLRFQLQDSGGAVLLTQEHIAQRLSDVALPVLRLDRDRHEIDRAPVTAPACRAVAGNACYVIYTSGSTGKPKGVVIRHEAAWQRMRWQQSQFPVASGDRVLQSFSFCFDASVWEIFAPLSHGGEVVILTDGDHRDPRGLVALLREHRSPILKTVPSMLRLVLDQPDLPAACRDLKMICCGGEELPPDVYERCRTLLPEVRLFNMYGPTETTINATWWEAGVGPLPTRIPIGRPAADTEIHLLDASLRPVPIGTRGEICIGGRTLARGYLNQPAATADRFVPHPFATEPGLRLYRSGDLGRLLPSGDIEFLGRDDDQVQIRGFRVEAGETEAALRAIPGVRDVRVLPRPAPGGAVLHAYLAVPRGVASAPWSFTALHGELVRSLPTYMIPARFFVLDRLPRLPSGKYDREALVATTEGEIRPPGDYRAPGTKDESRLTAIWEEVLDRERIGLDDNFFLLGGHSLVATRLLARVNREFGTDLPLSLVFERPTVQGMADALGEWGGQGVRERPPGITAARREPFSYANEEEE